MIDLSFLSFSLISQSLKILGILIGAYVVLKVSQKFIPKLLGKSFELVKRAELTTEEKRSQKRGETILGIVMSLVRVVIIFIALMMVLSELGIDITPIIASAGVLGLAVGFGAQTLVKDFINGIFILVEDQFSEGDLIKVGGFEGKVEKMTLRSTTLRDLSGVVHIIPNNKISDVSNLSKKWAQVNLDLQFSAKVEIDTAQKILKNVSEELFSTKKMQDLIITKPQILGIEEIDLGRFNFYKVKVIIKTQPLKQFEVARKYRYLFKKEMEKI